MGEIPEDVLDEVERALDVLTTGHGFSVANTGGGYGSPTRSSYYTYKCQCKTCNALARLRAAREGK